MTEAVYERYKDALRRGHVASLRGRLDEALEAYAEAASIARERPLPHTSIGGIRLRLGQVDEALAAFGAALARAPRDEGALLGRAEALALTGRPAQAAASYDLAAEVQEAVGRFVEALDTARRALELAESKPRRRAIERLVRVVREAASTPESEIAVERALRLLAGVEPEAHEPVAPQATAAKGREATSEAFDAAEPEVPEGAERSGIEAEPVAPAGIVELAGVPDAPESRPSPTEGAVEEAATEVEPPGAAPPEGSIEESAPPGPASDPRALAAEADAALDRGDGAVAREALLAAARADAAEGRGDAALDACYRALAVAPDDPELHLELADLYLAHGWVDLAATKLALLDRLVRLDGDPEAIALVEAAGRRLAAAMGSARG